MRLTELFYLLGEQHYHDIHSAFGASGNKLLYSERDRQKQMVCAEKGITLAIIPYWYVDEGQRNDAGERKKQKFLTRV